MRFGVVAVLAVVLCASTTYGREPAIAGWFELPVPGGAATLTALGIDAEESAFTLPLMARAFEGHPSRTLPPATAGAPVAVPAPLSLEAWRRALELQRNEDLFVRFAADRPALLLAYAFTATDDSLRTLAMRDRDLLRFLYRAGPGGFVVMSRSLRIAADRVVVPGGTESEAIWTALAGEPPTRIAPFIRALSTKDSGRLAWYFDTLANLDPPRFDAAWPVGRPEDRLRAAQELYDAFRNSDPQQDLQALPFRRTVADAWTVLTSAELDGRSLAGPSWLPLWEVLFSGTDVKRAQATRVLQAGMPRAALPWLVPQVVFNPPRERRDRFEMFRLAQRVFREATEDQSVDIAVALSGYRKFRGLLLTLERMDVRRPATWAAAVDAARFVDEHTGDDRAAIAAFQGSMALLERIRHVRTIDATTAEALVQSLSAAVQTDRRVTGAVATWLTNTLVPALPPLERPDPWTGRTAYESTILQALAGRSPATPRVVEWEGLAYHVDRAAAERARLRALRTLLPSPGLDAALAGEDRRALGDALTAILYSVALSDPDGPATLSRDVAQRHDFALRGTAIMREQRPWAPPEERQGLGPWHVQGSLFGLDLAMSRLALRRVADGQMPGKPVLTLNDLATLTRTVVALVPEEMSDGDRDALAATLERGRQRVANAQSNLAALQDLAHEVRMWSVARQLLPWLVSRQPEVVTSLFSLRDVLWLGRPTLDTAQLARWGVSGEGVDARRVTMFPRPASWDDFAGRSDLGQMTTQVPDLTLRLVEETARLRLPAELIPALLAFAVDDYWHETQARFADDWPSMVRQAAALDATRVEDYVAALTGNGPLRAQ